MATDKLGVTVMELFVYNPYRIIGVPVDATTEKIEETYKELLRLCETGEIATYKSPFDFPSLPPFQRNPDSLPAAYAKLDGDVYKCFAFSESLYAVSLSRADVAIQISNIDSYDKFLSCYMWLIINDRQLLQKNLWFKIAKHIDKLICSNPEDWAQLFDHRFPAEVYEKDMDSVKSFYNTFCEIILFPLKERVRGSMDCMTASEVLSIALFDGDIATLTSEIEHAEKAEQRRRDAEAAIRAKRAAEAAKASEEVEKAAEELAAAAPKAEPVAPAPVEVKTEPSAPAPVEVKTEPVAPAPVEVKTEPSAPAPVEVKTEAAAPAPVEIMTEPAAPAPVETRSEASAEMPALEVPKISDETYDDISEEEASLGILTSMETSDVEANSRRVNILVGDMDEEQENIYTEALHKMIESNRARRQMIRSIDPNKVFEEGNLNKEEDVELIMDNVSSKRYDEKLLDSPYDIPAEGEVKKTYNVDISDMINPQVGMSKKEMAGMRESFAGTENFFDQDKKMARKNKTFLKLTLFLIIVASIVTLCIIFSAEIKEFLAPLMDKLKDLIEDMKR